MSSNGLAKVTAKTAVEVCKHFSLGEEAKKLLRDGLTLYHEPFSPVLRQMVTCRLPKRILCAGDDMVLVSFA